MKYESKLVRDLTPNLIGRAMEEKFEHIWKYLNY